MLLSILAGLTVIAAGILRWERFTRFASVFGLAEFLSGAAIRIVLGQLGDLLDYAQRLRADLE